MTGHSVLVAGETLVDFLPDRPGPLTAETSFSTNFGGAGANVAMGLERLGVAPYFWTRIARDRFGEFLADRIAASDVPTDYVVRDAGAGTTLAFVTHDEDGEPTFEFVRERPADGRMESGTVPDETLADVDWVHVTAMSLSREPSRSATLELVDRARRRGCTVSLDPNARPELWNSEASFRVTVRGVLDSIDVVKAGPDDLRPAGFDPDQPPEALARSVAEYGPHTVFLTLGAEGALCYGTGESPFQGITRHPGYAVEPVDTTGSGDAFLAGCIAAATNGVTDAERVLGVANAVGAVTATERGALTALDDVDAVRELGGPLPWE